MPPKLKLKASLGQFKGEVVVKGKAKAVDNTRITPKIDYLNDEPRRTEEESS